MLRFLAWQVYALNVDEAVLPLMRDLMMRAREVSGG